MHCFKDHINNRKYFLHFIRLLLPPKSPILPNLGGDPYFRFYDPDFLVRRGKKANYGNTCNVFYVYDSLLHVISSIFY